MEQFNSESSTMSDDGFSGVPIEQMYQIEGGFFVEVFGGPALNAIDKSIDKSLGNAAQSVAQTLAAHEPQRQ